MAGAAGVATSGAGAETKGAALEDLLRLLAAGPSLGAVAFLRRFGFSAAPPSTERLEAERMTDKFCNDLLPLFFALALTFAFFCPLLGSRLGLTWLPTLGLPLIRIDWWFFGINGSLHLIN